MLRSIFEVDCFVVIFVFCVFEKWHDEMFKGEIL